MVWGAYMQPGFDAELDSLGAELSQRIGCAVHYPAYNKNLFECKCGVIFPVYLVKSRNWEVIIVKHQEERKIVRL